jgi:holo-[acyl-carrier protein] synthase
MQILGIGTDIIEIDRIARAVEQNPHFAERVFTKAELDYCLGKRSRHAHLAARFAAKEAVAKAVGKPLGWHDVEVVNGADRKPVVRLSGGAERAAQGCRILVTVSHSRNYATATAVVVRVAD